MSMHGQPKADTPLRRVALFGLRLLWFCEKIVQLSDDRIARHCSAPTSAVQPPNSGHWVLYCLLSILGALPLLADPGDVDYGFNAPPIFDADRSTFSDIVPDAEGRFLVVGGFGLVNGPRLTTVLRFRGDGTWDESLYLGSTDGNAITSVVMNGANRFVVAGNFTSIGGIPAPGIARFGFDGARDNSFKRFTDQLVYPRGARVLPDGRYVLFGDIGANLNGRPARGIVVLRQDGSLDPDSQIVLSGGLPSVGHVVVQPDARLIVFGHFREVQGFSKPWLARIFPDGRLDLTFKPPRLQAVETPLEVPPGVLAMTLQSDHKLLICGALLLEGAELSILRLNDDGSVDTTFSPPMLHTDQSGYQRYLVRTVAVDDNSMIYLGGQFTHAGELRCPSLVRLFPNGTVDDVFTARVASHLDALATNRIDSISFAGATRLLVGGDVTTRNHAQKYLVQFEREDHTQQQLTLRLSSSGNLAVGISPGAAQEVVVEYCLNLISTDWVYLTNALATPFNETHITLHSDGTESYRYFRARLPVAVSESHGAR